MIPFVQSGGMKKNKETSPRDGERKISQLPVDPVKKQSVSRETGHGRYNAG